MIGSIILVLLGALALIGLGNRALKDFGIPVLGVVLLLGAVVGLNFVPTVNLGRFYFSLGTALFFVMTVVLWLLRGKWLNRLINLLITVVLSGLIYGATRIAAYNGSTFWGNVNVFYALIAGVIAFIATRNAKYGFVTGALSIMTVSLLTQIGRPTVSLDLSYSWAIVAGALSVVLYTVVVRFIVPERPGRLSYYFEAGRMLDD